jgi:uncharacterized protein (DUF934 family)
MSNTHRPPFIRGLQAADNDWTTLADDAPVPAAGKVIVSLKRWRDDGAALKQSSALQVGVLIPNTEDAVALWPELQDRPLLALHWPAAGDGRAYSQARLLRERCGFGGELRAVGHVLRDQLQFMQRCGIDAFELRADQDLDDCLRAFEDFSLAYQRPAGPLPYVAGLRRS